MTTMRCRFTAAIWLAMLALPLQAAQEAPSQERARDEMPGADTQPTVAIFAGGCFWCMEPPFDELEGVKSTVSGYIGGHTDDPTYEQVSSGATGHTEAVQITYDPDVIPYQELLDVFWHNIDPVDADGQFCDRGSQYRSAIFYVTESQKAQAEGSRAELQKGRFERPIATEIQPAGAFYPAEEYHQDYYEKNPLRYKYYRYSCGRDQRLQEIWGGSAGS